MERDEQYLCTSIPVQISTVKVGGEDCTLCTRIPVQFSTVKVGGEDCTLCTSIPVQFSTVMVGGEGWAVSVSTSNGLESPPSLLLVNPRI